MSELTRLSQALIDTPLVERRSVEELRRRGRRRRRRHELALVAACVLSVAVVATSLSVVALGTHDNSRPAPPTGAALAAYYRAAVSVPDSTLETVGLPADVAVPTEVTPSLSTVATNGVVSYVGAEYCPYCALERWALLVALSKFGTFTTLDSEILSSSSDVYPHLASWSFVGAGYESPYFNFDATELFSTKKSAHGGYQRLATPSPAQSIALTRDDPQRELPFIDLGNRYVVLGSSASPAVLQGLSLGEIGGDLRSPANAVAQSIDGAANYLIAALCTLVRGATPSVCSSPVTRRAMRTLHSGATPSTGSSSATAPTQPPTNAPLSQWRAWSVKMHEFLLRTAATYRTPNHACTVLKIAVTPTRYEKVTLGVPPGVTVWAISLLGRCPTSNSKRVANSP